MTLVSNLFQFNWKSTKGVLTLRVTDTTTKWGFIGQDLLYVLDSAPRWALDAALGVEGLGMCRDYPDTEPPNLDDKEFSALAVELLVCWSDRRFESARAKREVALRSLLNSRDETTDEGPEEGPFGEVEAEFLRSLKVQN